MSLTTIEFQRKTYAGAHVKSQNHFLEFDLSLTKIQFSAKNQNSGPHVQSQTQFVEFDLSLTKIEFQRKTNAGAHVKKTNSIFLSLT